MGENHRVYQTYFPSKPTSRQSRNPCQYICPKINATDHTWGDTKSNRKPVSHHALDDQSSGEGIQGK